MVVRGDDGESAPRLSLAAREEVLCSLLDQYPDAWVFAATPAWVRTAVPPEVPLAGHRVIEQEAAALELLVPGDRTLMADAWRQALEVGVSHVTVHPIYVPGLAVDVHVIDLADRYGVVVSIVSGTTDEAVAAGGPALPARISVVSMDQESVVTSADDAMTDILGWSADELVGRPALELIHPDDVQVATSLMELLDRPGSANRMRLRHRHRDGSWRWIEVTNRNRLDDPGNPRLIAELVDVTDEVVAQQALHDNQQLLQRLTEALPVGVLHVSWNRAVTYRNARLESIVGIADATTVDEQLALVVEADRTVLWNAVDETLRSGRDTDVEVSFQSAGKPSRTVVSLRSLRALDGGVAGAVACVVDITDDAKLREELEQRVRYDALTGCLNHSSILAELQTRIRHSDGRAHVAVFFIDLDGFKDTNDRYGHVAGDRMLKHVANLLRRAAGADGLVGRVGGDEYLVVMPGADSVPAVRHLADDIVLALRRPVMLGGDWVMPKASVGAADVRLGPDVRADDLVTAADTAMYRSKRLGNAKPVVVQVD